MIKKSVVKVTQKKWLIKERDRKSSLFYKINGSINNDVINNDTQMM